MHERKTRMEYIPNLDAHIVKKRVCAYARVSSDRDEAFHSLSAQISYYQQKIAEHPDWKYVGVFSDRGITGTKENRPGFQAMLEACRKGEVDIVLAKSITRFARNTVILLETVRELRNLGIDIHFEEEHIETLSSKGEFMISILAARAQEESRSASENQLWRIRKSYEKGIPVTGNCLGYRMVKHQFLIDEDEEQIVLRIFSMYLSGMGTYAIAKQLNAEGIPNRNGQNWSHYGISHILSNEKYIGDLRLQKWYISDYVRKKKTINHGEKTSYYVKDCHDPIVSTLTKQGIKTPTGKDIWSVETVRHILTNEKYKGDARLQKTYTVDFLTKEVRVNNGERKQWYIQDSHDAIVSPETFELVQKELERRAGRHGRFYDSPFTRKIICGDCGAYYGHRVWHSNDPYRKNIWLCNEKYENGSICRPPKVTDEEIMQTFLIAVNRLPQDRNAYCDEYEREFLPLIGDTMELEAKRSALTKKLNDQIAQIERLVLENAQKAQNQNVYVKEFDAINSSIEQKKNLIHDIEQQISVVLSKKENARIYLEGLRNTASDTLITKFDIRLWHALVEYAKVMPDKTIIFHFRNGNEETVKLEKAQ